MDHYQEHPALDSQIRSQWQTLHIQFICLVHFQFRYMHLNIWKDGRIPFLGKDQRDRSFNALCQRLSIYILVDMSEMKTPFEIALEGITKMIERNSSATIKNIGKPLKAHFLKIRFIRTTSFPSSTSTYFSKNTGLYCSGSCIMAQSLQNFCISVRPQNACLPKHLLAFAHKTLHRLLNSKYLTTACYLTRLESIIILYTIVQMKKTIQTCY